MNDVIQAIGLANYIAGAFAGLLLAYSVWYRARTRDLADGEPDFLNGILIVGISFAAHQGYWGVWRLMRTLGDAALAYDMATYGGLVVAPLYLLIMYGTFKALSVVTGHHGVIPKSYFIAGAAVWGLGFIAGTVV